MKIKNVVELEAQSKRHKPNPKPLDVGFIQEKLAVGFDYSFGPHSLCPIVPTIGLMMKPLVMV